jgi:diguanylate cyclase (GGDEF)-like protein
MKLSRLLVTIISLLWLLIFIGTLTISTRNTRDYLESQMRSHAQDTATSLGLSLTTSLAANDLATMTSMVDAIFDRGYYQSIVIRSTSGNVLVERKQPLWVKDVPAWFTGMFTLAAPEGHALIMRGWNQAGSIDVVSHPGFAYKELWHVTLQAFWWVVAVGIAAFLLVALVVRLALAPLADMERQALGVARRQFITVKKLPWARELRRVAEAMNAMCVAVARMLGEQTALAARMRAKAYQDGVTGLANGRSFRERLDHLLSSTEEFSVGALVFVRLDRFEEYNDKHGHAAGNDALQRAAQALGSVCCTHERCLLGRLNGPEFAMLVPDITADEIGALGDIIVSALKGTQAGEEDTPAYVGIAFCQAGQSASVPLAAADMALAAAYEAGRSCWRLHGGEPLAPRLALSASERKTLIETALKNDSIVLHFQAVSTTDGGAALHHEALARIGTADGILQPAGVFMPTANRHGLAPEIDKQVVTKALAHLQTHRGMPERLAVNLSGPSLRSAAFVDWLCAKLAAHAAGAQRLAFEVSELALLDDLDAGKAAIGRIQQAGARFGVDRFGHSAASLGHLRSLNVDYIKIDGSYIRHLDRNEDGQFFLQALTGIAHGLNIKVIAECVETTEELDALRNLRIDGAQGLFIGAPTGIQ